MHFVLLNPQIPQNTGNIGRTAAALGATLHIIHPIGFDMSEKARRRAGLDYWHLITCNEHKDWTAFLETEKPGRMWLFTTKATRPHWDAAFSCDDYLLFGCEDAGAPGFVHDHIVQTYGEDHRVMLPMRPEARSLNLATAVAIAAYEVARQTASC